MVSQPVPEGVLCLCQLCSLCNPSQPRFPALSTEWDESGTRAPPAWGQSYHSPAGLTPNPLCQPQLRSLHQFPNPTRPSLPCSSLSHPSLQKPPNFSPQPGTPAVFAQPGQRAQPGDIRGWTDLLPAPSLPESSWMEFQPLQAPRERCAAGTELPGLRTCSGACPALPLPHTRAAIPSKSSLSSWEPPLPSRGQGVTL